MVSTSCSTELLETLELGLGLGKVCLEVIVASLDATNTTVNTPARVRPRSLPGVGLEVRCVETILKLISGELISSIADRPKSALVALVIDNIYAVPTSMTTLDN